MKLAPPSDYGHSATIPDGRAVTYKRLNTGSYLMGNAFDFAAGLGSVQEPERPRYMNEILPLRTMSIKDVTIILGVLLLCFIGLCAVTGSPVIIVFTGLLAIVFKGMISACASLPDTDMGNEHDIQKQKPHGNSQFATADDLQRGGFIE